MSKNEQRSAKNNKKAGFSLRENDLFCTESVLLRGNHSAVFYGCDKILFYGRERICFSMGRRAVSVLGDGLCCTVFSPSGVTVEGHIDGICYCNSVCSQNCPKTLRGEENV